MTSNTTTISLAPTLVRRPLHDGWEVLAAAGPAPAEVRGAPVPATVPGTVHDDLLAAGLIPDPYLDDNEALLAWIGLTDWTYRTVFSLAASELDAARHDLVFDGIDTVASLHLNGTLLGEVANQHRTFRFDVTELVREGDNELVVAFRSPVKHADAQSIVLGARPRPYPTPYEAIRKSAASFGWDWGIATATSGLWRPVHLESWSTARLAQVLVHAEPNGAGGTVSARVQIAAATEADLTLRLDVAGVRAEATLAAGSVAADLVATVPDVELWWPVGHGAQPRYDVEVSLRREDELLDRVERRVGFRSLRWDTEPDADGTPFQLVVNDRPVYVKGVNWIPDDALVPRVDRARYRRRLEQARSAHVNLIRVWGGGIYEADDFYDLCDELGLLTWQDFLFACAAYPEEEPLRSEVVAEARDNVARLAHHPSLALLTGNNENLWGYEDWGWQLLLDGRTWGEAYYRELLPQIVAELAPHVPYAPGSPFSPHGQHPNDEDHGSTHLWEQWNRRDWLTYREHSPRFVAEFGWQGPPTWTTLTRSISDDPLTPESPGMIVHQKAMEGNTKLANGLVRHYRVPDGIEAWHWAMQLNQAVAVRTALDWFRSSQPRNSGAIVWQLNDCWPVTSWAAIDGDGREKPLLFALKNAFTPRVVTIQPDGAGLVAVVVNDTDEPWRGRLGIRRRAFDGTVLADEGSAVDVPARGIARVAVPETAATSADAATEVLEAVLDDARGWWYFAEGRDSALPAAAATVAVAPADGGWQVTVTAVSFLRDLTLLPDRLGPAATVDSGLVSLFPGESHVFRVKGVDAVTDAAVDARVLRTANELVIR